MEYLFWICLGLIAFTYLIYPLFIFFLASFFPQRKITYLEDYPEVTMVIAANNEESVLEEKIKNCLAIEYPKDKIRFLIGSDGSTDRTNEILTSAPAQIESRIFTERGGKIRVLNKLLPDIGDGLVVFSDANSMYHPKAVQLLVPHFANDDIGGVCGNLNLVNPSRAPGGTGEGIYWRYENMIKGAEGRISSVISANGAIFSIRRELFEPLPENVVVNDDFAITLSILRQGKRVIFEPYAIAEENTSPDMVSEYKRRIRISCLNFNAFPELVAFLRPKYGMTALALFSHKILRWLVPFFGLGMLISNILLFGQGGVYPLLLSGQVLLYIFALFGYLGDQYFEHSGPFILFYYLMMMNVAQGVGLWRSLTKTQEFAWERVPH